MFNFYKKESRWLRGIPIAIVMSLVCSIWSHAATYYSKAAATDFTATASWGANTNGSGAAPGSISNADDFIIQNGSALNLNAGNAAVRTLVINAGSLTVGTNTLTVSLTGTDICTSNLTVNTGGTLSVSGTGNVIINGQFQILGTATLNQTGGLISVDGNGNAVALNSVTGSIVNFTSNALTLSGGTLRIVDPHQATGLAFQLNNASSVGIVASGTHTLECGNGTSTQAGGSAANGLRFDTWTGSARIHFNNFTVNGAAGTNRHVTSVYGFGINGNLVVNSGGELRMATIAVGKDITVNAGGTLTTTTTVNMAVSAGTSVPSGPSTVAQTISGAGTFRNSATVPTANFAGLTINNTNATGVTISGDNAVMSGANTGTLSGALGFTAGLLRTTGLSTKTLTVGISTSAVGSISWTAGGVAPGTTLRRWVTATTISTATSATTNFFPMASGTSSRMVRLNRNTTGSTTVAGWVECTHTNTAGFTADGFTDGAYVLSQRTNSLWSFNSGGGFAVTGNIHMALCGDGLIVTSALPATATAPRIMQVGAAAGAYLASSGTTAVPFGARTFTGASSTPFSGSQYLGINSADIGLYSVTNGAWDAGTTWSTGVVPTSTDNPLISSGNTVTVSAAAAAALTVTVNGTLTVSGNTLTVTGASGTGLTVGAAGSLNVSGGTINIGPQDNSFCNRAFTNNGTLTVSSGDLNVAGSFTVASTAFISQTGGTIKVDGNAAGVAGNSIAGNIVIFNQPATSTTLSGGTLLIVDPSYTTSYCLYVNNGSATPMVATGTHTLQLGNATSTDAGGTNGFYLNLWVGSTNLSVRNLQISANGGTNRFVSSIYSYVNNGNITIDANSESRIATVYLGGNLTNNGVFTSTTTLGFLNYDLQGGVITSVTSAQAVGGSGVFRNLAASPTANLTGLRWQNTSAGGVTLNVPLTVSGQIVPGEGKLNTTSTNILTHVTTTTNNVGFLATTVGYVSGPMRVTIPTFTNFTARFPVGKTQANHLAFFNTITTGPVTIEVETNNSVGAPSAIDGTLLTLNSGREWLTSIVSGAANLTSFSVQGWDANMANGNALAKIQSPATEFSALGTGSTFVSAIAPLPNALALNVPPIAAVDFPERIGFGTTGPYNVSSITMAQTGIAAITSSVSRGVTNANLSRTIISVLGSSGTITLNDIKYTYTGTAPIADITAVTIWTGTFAAPVTQVGTTTINGLNEISYSGLGVNIGGGNNYLWLRFDVSATAGLGNTVDVELASGDASGWATTGGATVPGTLPALTQAPSGNVLIDYCLPTFTNACSSNDVLTAFSLNTLSAAPGCPGALPNNYAKLVATTTMEQGNSYTASFTVGTGGAQGVGIWFDFNKDGDFADAGEYFGTAATTAASASGTLNITIDPLAVIGTTRMRVINRYNATTAQGDVCLNPINYGTVFDFDVTITSPSPRALGTITAVQQTGGIGTSTTNNNLLRVDFPTTGALGTLTLSRIRFQYTGTSAADIAASGVTLWTGTSSAPTAQVGSSLTWSGGFADFTGLSVAVTSSTYLWLRVNSSASATIANLVDAKILAGDITITAAGGATAPGSQPAADVDPSGSRFIDYCQTTYTNGPGTTDNVTNVTLNGAAINLSNTTGSSASPYYTFYNALNKPDLYQGGAYTVSVTFGTDATQWGGVWIDFNNNGLFDVSEFFGSTADADASGTANIAITVPAGAVLGDRRMRVRGGEDAQLNSGQSCGASSSGYGETEDYIITVIAPPNCSTIGSWPASATTSSASTVCNGSSIDFGLTVAMPLGTGITYQLQRNGVDQGSAQTGLPLTFNVTTSGNWGIVVKCNGTSVLTTTTVALTVLSPTVTSATGATRCGPGTLSLSAVGSAGTTLRWYTTATLGASISSGLTPNTYVTANLTAPSVTNYYVEASTIFGSGNVGAPDPNVGAFGTSFTGVWERFNASVSSRLVSVDLYPTAAGSGVIELRTSLGAVIGSANFTVTAGDANSTGSSVGSPFTVPLNFNIPVATGLELWYVSGPTCLRNSGGAGSYYSTPSNGITFTANWVGSNVYWYNMYNWSIESSCASPTRTLAAANVTSPPVLNVTVSNNNICDGTSTVLNAAGSGYSTYTWTPGPLTGALQTVSPNTTTNYLVTASGGGCNNVNSVLVTVRPTPTNPVIVASPVGGRCLGQSKTLTTSSTTAGSVELLREGFNAASLPGTWSVSYSGVSVPFQVGVAPFTYGTQITNFSVTTPASNFVVVNSDALTTSAGTSSLISPSFSTLGRTTVNLAFTHVLRSSASDNISVEYTTNGGTNWLATSFNIAGTTTPTQTWNAAGILTQDVSFALPAGAANKASVQLRFTYSYSWDYYWMFDNVVVTANDVVSYRWTDNTSFGGIPVPQTTYSTSNSSAVVTPTQGGPITYTVQAINTANCPALLSGTHSFNVSDIQVAASATGPQRVGTTLNLSAAGTVGGFGGYSYQWVKTAGAGSGPGVINSTVSFGYPGATVNNSGTYQVTVSDGNSCSATASVDALVYAALVWNGSQSNSWNDPLNWTPSIVPANGTDCTTPLSRDNVVITNSGTAPQYPGAGVYVDNFGVESGLLTISNNVRVCGSLSGGNLVGKVVGAGSIELVGSGTNIVGGLLELDKLVINKSGVGPVQIQGVLRINDLMTVTAAPGGINVGSSGNVVLVSTPSTTGKIGPIPAGTSVTVSAPGKFTQQRYVNFPSGSEGDWYFLSSPIQNKLFTDWADDFRVVGLSTGFGTQGGDILPSVEPERNTIFKYNEAVNNVYIDTVQKRGWRAPSSIDNINPGQGYRVFVKKESVTLFDNQGLIHSGDKNMTITRTEAVNCQTGVTSSTISACTEDWRGWNLLGNPYPCDIDWDATGAAWTKPAQMQNAWHRWNSSGQGYGLYTNGVGYVGAGPAPANPNVIPSSQAFFVKAATPGAYSATLAVKETAKITNTSGQFARVNAASQKLRIGISRSMNPADYGYDAVIRFMPEATDGYDFTYDFASLGGNNFSLGVPVDQSLLAVASFAPISDSKIVPISISYKGSVGNFFLKFSQMETLLEDNSIFLRDNLIGSIMEVTPGFIYNYQVTSTDGLTGDRFELIFNPTVVTGVNASLAAGAGMNVFPNPNAVGKSTNVALRGFDVNAADVVVYDALGRVVFSKEVALTNGSAQVEIKSELPAGVYTVKAVGGSLTLTKKLAVR